MFIINYYSKFRTWISYEKKLAIIGLAYIGLQLAHAFSKKYEVVGFDLYQTRIDELNNAHDREFELSKML